MPADFQTCYEWVLPHEAGNPPNYNVTNDNKGQVCAGINSLAFPADFAAIAALPIDERPTAVAGFYRRTYWNQFIAQLNSNAVAAYAMDAEVNEGQRIGCEIVQEAVNSQRGETWLEVDGEWGPITISEVNDCDPTDLLPALKTCRDAAYQKIGGPNLLAWLARAALIPPFA
jgi:lysozyme family protein